MTERAANLHQRSVVVDGMGASAFFPELQKAGGITAINVTLATNEESLVDVLKNFSRYFELLYLYPDQLILIESVNDIYRAKQEGKVGIILGFQGLAQIGHGLHLIPVFHKLGLRISGLVYNESNLIGSSCAERVDAGLTFHGRQVVHELNRLGIVIDLSHAGDRTSLDANELSEAPAIISHSNARRLCNHPRNVPDELIKAVAEKGGVIGLAQYSVLLDVGPGHFPTIDTWLDHIDYVVQLVGIDHAGLGVDAESGVFSWQWWATHMITYKELVPSYYMEPEMQRKNTHNVAGFTSNADLPKVTAGLAARGYSDDDIQKILGLNWHRIYKRVWKDGAIS